MMKNKITKLNLFHSREKRGSCISNLILVSVSEKYGRFLHEFQRSKDHETSEINVADFSEQEYVIISTNKRINISSAFVDSITSSTVSVHCEKYVPKYFYTSKVYDMSKFYLNLIYFQRYNESL